ncbi:MAG: substrate-binding domain-containing protein [Opitutales bacterium]|nr:substrate-binding domain-containing protein [Opitutales bacterium]
MEPNKRIAIILGLNTPWHRSVLAGLPLFRPRSGRWTFNIFRPDADGAAQMRRWHPDGILGAIDSAAIARTGLDTGLPTVSITEGLPEFAMHRVVLDGEACGRLAAGHLTETGVSNFAYVGWKGHPASPYRLRGFQDGLLDRQQTPEQIDLSGFGTDRPIAQLVEWLLTLQRPCGLFCFNDITAMTVLHAAAQIGLRVPEDLAVLGVDNDEALCTLMTPGISSVSPRPRLTGKLAADLLDRLILGEVPPLKRIPVQPRGVIQRASTDHLSIADEGIARAVRHIREHAGSGINVAEVAQSVGIGRRTLEKGIQRELGHSPLEEIQRARIRLARHFLSETTLPLEEVATRSGFRDLNHLTRTFRARLSTTPGAYRRERRSTNRSSRK